MIDTIVAVCQTKAEADNWVSLLQKHSNNSSPAHEAAQPQSLPHVSTTLIYLKLFLLVSQKNNKKI